MKKFFDKLVDFGVKLSQQIHLRSLRDASAITMPLVILAGFMILINALILDPNGFMSSFVKADTLLLLQGIGTRVQNATLGIWTLAQTVAIAYCLAKNREFDEPLIPCIVALACLVTLVPLSLSITPTGAEKSVMVSGILSQDFVGIKGVFTGMLVSCMTTELFIKVSRFKKLEIKMPEGVPPMVAKSFSSMIPFLIVVIIFALFGFLLDLTIGMSFTELIIVAIQTPIKNLTTSLPGFLIAMVLFNLLFATGIHPSAIVDTVIGPGLTLAMNENMQAFAAGQEAQNIITTSFKQVYGLIGGTGCTICLIIAVLIFSKRKNHRMIAKLGLAPGIFNINEPIIFGFPIVMNPILIIPFVLVTQVSFMIAYLATSIGLVGKCVVEIPWVTPPILSAYLTTAGDIKAAILQIILIVIGVLIYLPFLRVSERSLNKSENTTTE